MSTPEARKRANRRHFERHKEAIYAKRRAAYHAKKQLGPVWTPEQLERRKLASRKWMKKHQREWKQHRREKLAGRPKPETCEVCGRRNGRWGIMFDHCHKTGKFRGWLCYSCNTILGHADDNPEILRKLIDYLTAQSLAAPSAKC